MGQNNFHYILFHAKYYLILLCIYFCSSLDFLWDSPSQSCSSHPRDFSYTWIPINFRNRWTFCAIIHHWTTPQACGWKSVIKFSSLQAGSVYELLSVSQQLPHSYLEDCEFWKWAETSVLEGSRRLESLCQSVQHELNAPIVQVSSSTQRRTIVCRWVETSSYGTVCFPLLQFNAACGQCWNKSTAIHSSWYSLALTCFASVYPLIINIP